MASLTHATPDIVKKLKKVTERTDYILNIFLTEYPHEVFMHASRIFTVCVYCKWTNLHGDDNEKE